MTRSICPWTRALLAWLLLALPTLAQQGIQRPNLGEGPTQLRTQVFALDIDEIDSASQSFTANLFVSVRWQDDRLAHAGPGNRTMGVNEAWSPNLQFVNQQKVFRTFPEMLTVTPSGEVIYRQRVWGQFSQKLQLQDFPFDDQRFQAILVPSLPDVSLDDVVMVKDEEHPSGLDPNYSLPDWSIVSWEVGATDYNPAGIADPDPAYVFAFETRRHVGYYYFKVILPLLLIVAMSWIVCWIDPKEMGTQVSIAVTSMLTLIAYRFMVGQDLPNVSYLTRMDLFILGSTVIVFVSLFEAVLTGVLAKGERVRAARAIDWISRILFPVSSALVAYLTLVH